jgi:hypothetical protein
MTKYQKVPAMMICKNFKINTFRKNSRIYKVILFYERMEPINEKLLALL